MLFLNLRRRASDFPSSCRPPIRLFSRCGASLRCIRLGSMNQAVQHQHLYHPIATDLEAPYSCASFRTSMCCFSGSFFFETTLSENTGMRIPQTAWGGFEGFHGERTGDSTYARFCTNSSTYDHRILRTRSLVWSAIYRSPI